MTLWRVSNHATLDGRGGLFAPGRWHNQGARIVYCAPNPATALLEVLVHAETDPEDAPARFGYLEIDVPDDLAIEEIPINGLGRSWKSKPQSTRRIGDEWLRSGRTALLRVPSVIAPATWNTLLNPRHPDAAAVRIVRRYSHILDPRLRRRG